MMEEAHCVIGTPTKGNFPRIREKVLEWGQSDFLRWPPRWALKEVRRLGGQSTWSGGDGGCLQFVQRPRGQSRLRDGLSKHFIVKWWWWVLRGREGCCRVLSSRVTWSVFWFQNIPLAEGSRMDSKRAWSTGETNSEAVLMVHTRDVHSLHVHTAYTMSILAVGLGRRQQLQATLSA